MKSMVKSVTFLLHGNGHIIRSLTVGSLLFLCVMKAEDVPRPRLINGLVSYAGIVQVLHGGVWHQVCGDSWDLPTANVTCHQLGFQDGALLALKGFPFGGEQQLQTSSKFFVVRCQGLESSLAVCLSRGVSTNACSKGLANVVCRNTSINLNETSIRLRGANASHAGRVEIRYAGIWGRVCSKNWDENEATVVCRQLGYHDAIKSAVTSQNIFGESTGPDWLNVDCQGDEKSLTNCSHGGWGQCNEDINDKTSANVICKTGSNNATVIVRLLGTSPSAGQVQVRYNGLWGAVLFSGWDDKDGHVVCRQLGFKGVASVYEEEALGPGQGLVWLTDVKCAGNESSIDNCSHPEWGSRAAHVTEATAGVQCYTNESAGDFTFRLQGSESPNAGRVEVLIKGEWGKICNHLWDMKDTGVLCRELGFPGAVMALSGSAFGEGTGPGLMDYVRCMGLETSLAHCPHRRTKSCGIRSVAGVICSPSDNSTQEIRVRLVSTMQGPPNSGRVEVRFTGAWGTVCRSDFEKVDADVLCRQLGYPAAQELAPDSMLFGQGAGPIWLSHLGCTGNETSIDQCPRGVEWGKATNCTHTDDVGIICQLSPPNKTENVDDIYVPIIIEMNIAQWNVATFKLAVATALTEQCRVTPCFVKHNAQSEAMEFKSSDIHIPRGFPKALSDARHILVNVSVMKPDDDPPRAIPAKHLETLLVATSQVISQNLGHTIVQVNETLIEELTPTTAQMTAKVLGARQDDKISTRPTWIIAIIVLVPVAFVIALAAIMHLICRRRREDSGAPTPKDDKDVETPLQEIKT